MQHHHTLATAAAKAGMDEKTARKYRRLGKLPSDLHTPHTWRTHDDPFEDVWDEVRLLLETNPGLEAKALFQHLQRQHPARFADGQLRTFQRRVKRWRALDGPPKEVFFEQDYRPGERAQSDFTSMNALGVTLAGTPFDHLLYHFVLPYSNWETGTICFSESFESLASGLQNALFELGGVPLIHHTDSMSAAVRRIKGGQNTFTDRYQALLRHYGLRPMHSQPQSPNELGDTEQRHHRFKLALEQALLLRGSRDFESRAAYAAFLDKLFVELNRGRRARLEEELLRLRRLPLRRFETFTRLEARVSAGSTIRVVNNVYSVPSRLVGERVEVRLFPEHVEVHYAQRCVERMPRLRGAGRHRINYRHVIDALVRKPGAFAHYRYRSELFPTHRFRMAYDMLRRGSESEQAASKAYLKVLHLAARGSEGAVEAALAVLMERGEVPRPARVAELVSVGVEAPSRRDVEITPVALTAYDTLLSGGYGDGATAPANPVVEVPSW